MLSSACRYAAYFYEVGGMKHLVFRRPYERLMGQVGVGIVIGIESDTDSDPETDT